MKTQGSFLVLFLPCALVFVSVAVLTWRMAAWLVADARAQTVVDAVLCSSLRLRVEALETIAARWNDVGRTFAEGDASGHVLVPQSYWSRTRSQANTLSHAIPGYKGRITAVLTVVAEANGFRREQFHFQKDDAQNLGVRSESVVMRNEINQLQNLSGGWYRREWASTQAAPQPPEESVLVVETVSFWPVRRRSRAVLAWDVDPAAPEVQARGNGGYPRQWTQALEGNQVIPHRFPVYAVKQKGEQ